MQRILLKSKLHRVTTTDADLNYEGSCGIDDTLLEAANIIENEKIDIWNVTNGARFSTYAIRAGRGSGTISINGSAARHAMPGDILIIASFANYDDAEIPGHAPSIIFVDAENRIVKRSA
ncbi:MAG: aspartate 1-decarboxylase [Candidatus Accumulibacter sp.]|jgi:aspartate 1-decarboxylase|nr:aspartate 1-decarboxylase [Accumulibacter sp.]